MLRTITIGSTISVQGWFLRQNGDGTIDVGCGEQVFTGLPVPSWTKTPTKTSARLSASTSDLETI